jgi:mono/diheme cytochrome c family protein
VPNQSPGGRPYADADEVPAPPLDEQAATQQPPEEEENLTSEAKAGKKIFQQNCVGCHTQDKDGVIAAIKDWKKDEWEQAIDAVTNGRMPKNKPGSIKGKELEDLIAYFKSQIAKEDLVAEGKKEQKEATADVPQAQPPVPGANPLAQGSSLPPSAGTAPQAPAHSISEPVAAPSFEALTEDLTEKTTGDLLIAREATKGIRFSQEEVQKEDQRREKIDAEISRRQQAGSRSRMPVLRPKRVVAAQPPITSVQTTTSGVDEQVNRLVGEFLWKQWDPMDRFKRRTGEEEAPSAYKSSTMRAPNLQLQGYRW